MISSKAITDVHLYCLLLGYLHDIPRKSGAGDSNPASHLVSEASRNRKIAVASQRCCCRRFKKAVFASSDVPVNVHHLTPFVVAEGVFEGFTQPFKEE